MTRQGMNVTVIAPQSLTKHWLRKVPLAPCYFTQEVDGRTIHIYRPYSLTAGDGRLGFITRWCNRLVTTRTAKRLRTQDAVYAHFWLNAAMAIPFVQQKHLPLVVATGEAFVPLGTKLEFDGAIYLNDWDDMLTPLTYPLNDGISPITDSLPSLLW